MKVLDGCIYLLYYLYNDNSLECASVAPVPVQASDIPTAFKVSRKRQYWGQGHYHQLQDELPFPPITVSQSSVSLSIGL